MVTKKERGITLVALIITIAIMLIIAGISISAGTEALDDTRLKGFYIKLDIVQKRVDDIAVTNESYIDSNGHTIYIKESGTEYASLISAKQQKLQSIIQSEGRGLDLNAYNFRYFTSTQLETILDLPEIEYNLFIDFDNRVIIAEDGITVNGETHHMLESTTYFTNRNEDKNIGTIENLGYVVSEYGENNYKVVIIPSNTIGDLDSNGILKYKKTTSKYWEISTDLEMIVELESEYNVIYTDKNNNSIEKIIIVQSVEDEYNNKNLIVTELN